MEVNNLFTQVVRALDNNKVSNAKELINECGDTMKKRNKLIRMDTLLTAVGRQFGNMKLIQYRAIQRTNQGSRKPSQERPAKRETSLPVTDTVE